MKAKTIKSILSRKIQAWANSIDDPAVKKLVEENTIVTGGAITSLLMNEKPNDYDVYFRTAEAAYKVCEYYVNKFKANPPPKFKNGGDVLIYLGCENGVPIPSFDMWNQSRLKVIVKSAGVASEGETEDYQYFEGVPDAEAAGEYVEAIVDQAKTVAEDSKAKPEYRPVFLTSNAISLSDDIQIVARFFGEPDEIHSNYDFLHCMNYWTSWDRQLVVKPESLMCILNKDLVYVGSKYPLCSLFRIRKFLDRGWNINAGQILKAAMQVSDLDLTNPAVLEDQLIGVDTAYFSQLISMCKANMEKTGSTTVDKAYIVELIDRIF